MTQEDRRRRPTPAAVTDLRDRLADDGVEHWDNYPTDDRREVWFGYAHDVVNLMIATGRSFGTASGRAALAEITADDISFAAEVLYSFGPSDPDQANKTVLIGGVKVDVPERSLWNVDPDVIDGLTSYIEGRALIVHRRLRPSDDAMSRRSNSRTEGAVDVLGNTMNVAEAYGSRTSKHLGADPDAGASFTPSANIEGERFSWERRTEYLPDAADRWADRGAPLPLVVAEAAIKDGWRLLGSERLTLAWANWDALTSWSGLLNAVNESTDALQAALDGQKDFAANIEGMGGNEALHLDLLHRPALAHAGKKLDPRTGRSRHEAAFHTLLERDDHDVVLDWLEATGLDFGDPERDFVGWAKRASGFGTCAECYSRACRRDGCETRVWESSKHYCVDHRRPPSKKSANQVDVAV